ncbi:hypothetical protein [Agromyces lapidis]|uniref:DUF1049 domain-containing protein n=1 Tax=Agromyces lapidis TaxID=279574 RepID=A0ABV5SWH7_9MICO|nr:hypothetical protein [Agromyces lapidis]
MPEPTPDERRDDAERLAETTRLDATARLDDDTETPAFDRVLADETPLTPAPSPAPGFPAAATATAPIGEAAATSTPLPRPTIRWGALVWALLFGTIAGFTLWTLVDLQHRDEVLFWIAAVPMQLVPLYLLAAAGVVVALFGVVGLIRRGERQRRAARG